MSFDLAGLTAAVASQGVVTRVVVAGIEGSCPREVGAAMLIWDGGQTGTIGGGALEWQAAKRAHKMEAGSDRLDRIPLGPALGQCCGGAVTLISETFDEKRIIELAQDVVLRQVEGTNEIPLKIKQALTYARNSANTIKPELVDGWMLEPVSPTRRPLWIYGAGHVGRALVSVLAPFPDFAITWVDIAPDRFPADLPSNVTRLVAANPGEVVKYAPEDGEHLILTYSHALDLELCHQVLVRGFATAGLIGSRSKWVRFRNRLRKLGHTDTVIDRIDCPIGQPELGKHPQAIAVGVTRALLLRSGMENIKKDMVG